MAAKIKREQMLLDSFATPEQVSLPEDDVLLEAFARRPSQHLQFDKQGRLLTKSQSKRNRSFTAEPEATTNESAATEASPQAPPQVPNQAAEALGSNNLLAAVLTRRPSQTAQLQIAERLATSPSPAVRLAAEQLLGQQFPEEEELEAEPLSPKSSLAFLYSEAERLGLPPPATIDMSEEEVDVQTLENPTPEESDDEGYDSD